MIDCIDIFCGAGGLSLGLRQAGVSVNLAVDIDAACLRTYSQNHDSTKIVQGDVSKVSCELFEAQRSQSELLLLAGGPPCQLFSRLNRRGSDNPTGIKAYVRVLRAASPDFAVFENVPAIVKKSKSWNYLMSSFKRLGYQVSHGVLAADSFGVPQKRRRMIVIASRHGDVELPVGNDRAKLSVKKAIGHLPHEFGFNADHYGMQLSARNLQRIRELAQGETSRDKSQHFSDSYARMWWNDLAPTITTKCISFSNGRFGHPEFDRALTIHEAAILQGFPRCFRFSGVLWEKAKQVGNAVPPPIGRAVGNALLAHL